MNWTLQLTPLLALRRPLTKNLLVTLKANNCQWPAIKFPRGFGKLFIPWYCCFTELDDWHSGSWQGFQVIRSHTRHAYRPPWALAYTAIREYINNTRHYPSHEYSLLQTHQYMIRFIHQHTGSQVMACPQCFLNNGNSDDLPWISHKFRVNQRDGIIGSPSCSKQSESGSISIILTFVEAKFHSPLHARVPGKVSGVRGTCSKAQQVNKAK